MSWLRTSAFMILYYLVLVAETQPQIRGMEILGSVPDFALVMLCVYAVERGPTRATCLGFFIGLLKDSVGAGALGAGALVGAVTGYIAGRLGDRIYKKQLRTQALFTVLIACVSHGMAVWIDVGGNVFEALAAFPGAVLVRAIYTGAMAPFFFVVGLFFLARSRKLHDR